MDWTALREILWVITAASIGVPTAAAVLVFAFLHDRPSR
jgi:hypothetical protein